MSRVSQSGMVADASAPTIVSLTDSTTGTASDTLNDTTANTKDDLASLAAKIEECIVVLRNAGLIQP